MTRYTFSAVLLCILTCASGCAQVTPTVTTLPAVSRNVYSERIYFSRTRGKALDLAGKRAEATRHAPLADSSQSLTPEV